MEAEKVRGQWTVLVCATCGGSLNGRSCVNGHSSYPAEKVEVVPAQSLTEALEALERTADDLGKAANQFASIRESQKAGHTVVIRGNPEVFAEKERAAREVLARYKEEG